MFCGIIVPFMFAGDFFPFFSTFLCNSSRPFFPCLSTKIYGCHVTELMFTCYYIYNILFRKFRQIHLNLNVNTEVVFKVKNCSGHYVVVLSHIAETLTLKRFQQLTRLLPLENIFNRTKTTSLIAYYACQRKTN